MAKKKSIKLEKGTVYQKTENGTFYYRYQINGKRKAVSLKTKNEKEAIAEAEKVTPVTRATSIEVISAHVKQARNLEVAKKSLELNFAWEKYSNHPERAMPATVSEQEAYKSTFNEFLKFIDDITITVNDITPEIADKFAQHMRGLDIAVDTHNRKIRRLKKVFDVLEDYRSNPNPFTAKSLKRKEREEQDNKLRRLSFTREQEAELLAVLENDKFRVINKPEIRVVYHIGMFTGQRMKDCVLLRWDSIDFNHNKIWVKQFKTGKEVTIPIAPQLRQVLEEAQAWTRNQYVCPNSAERYNKTNANGKNVGNNLVNIDVLRAIKWIGLEPSVKVPGRKKKVTIYGFHSLRHSFASHCAEAGVPKAVVVSILGADSEIVDKYYTHVGDEAQQKAIMAISNHKKGLTDRERITKALAYIDQLSTDEQNENIQTIKSILTQI